MLLSSFVKGVSAVQVEIDVVDRVVDRVAGLDVGKASVVCCVRVRRPDGRVETQVSEHAAMVSDMAELAAMLVGLGVERVVMEATGDYFRLPFYMLEAAGLDPWLVNARAVKHVPGRPKTDVLDAQWLAKLAEKGLVRPSFVPPPEFRDLRDLTRYRCDLVRVRNAEKQRIEKLLESGCVKLSVVASDIFGVSGRQMLSAIAAGERDPQVLARMARARLKIKTKALQEAFAGLQTGLFRVHHQRLLSVMLAQVDGTQARIDAVDAAITEALSPF